MLNLQGNRDFNGLRKLKNHKAWRHYSRVVDRGIKRAHLMNVYVKKEFRRKGLAKKMLELLIEEAKSRKVTEISLDATEKGRPLYESMGFSSNDSAMTMKL